MENRLKERLTGAAILVALIVLIVPEMFRGQRTAAPRTTAAASSDGPPQRSFTINLNNTGAGTIERDSAPAVSTQNVPAIPPVVAALPPPPVTAQAPPIEPAPTAPLPVAPKTTPRTAPRTTATQSAPAAVHPAHRRETASSSAPSSGASSGKGWTVQLGLFSKSDNAQRLLHSAQGKGFSAHVSRYGPKGLYRVAIAGVADRATAEQLSRRIRAAGLPAAILGPR